MRRCAPPAVRSWCAMGAATSAATVAERAAARDGGAGTCPLNRMTMEAAVHTIISQPPASPSMDAPPGFSRYHGLKGEEADVLERNYCAPPARIQRSCIAATP